MWRKFKKHRLGLGGLICFGLILSVVLFPEFTAPYTKNQSSQYSNAPPMRLRFFDEEGNFHLRPFIYELEREVDFDAGNITWAINKERRYPLQFFVRGSSYKLLFIRSDLHLYGFGNGFFAPLGTDRNGRDLFSRILYGGRTSIMIAVLTAIMTLGLGVPLGLISGYFSGVVDLTLQRIMEVFIIIPDIPLALALAAFLPPDLSPVALMFGIAGVLSIGRFAGTARQVRGKALSVREEDFVMSAKSVGASTTRLLKNHIFPPILSHVIVVATLVIPSAIISEAGLSFLGFGIRPPMTSWGLLLKRAQNLRVIANTPWLMLPGLAIIVTVLSLNFIGDAIRDAADPYSIR